MFRGYAFGGVSPAYGEVVFTTGMTGYTESLTDPSFSGQILTFTYPLIGNYGVPKISMLKSHLAENFESERIRVQGVVCNEASAFASHADNHETIDSWLMRQGIPGISDIDTRALTQKLRERGVMRGQISDSAAAPDWNAFPVRHEVRRMSLREPVPYAPPKPNGKHVVLIDCGVKHGIIRALLTRGYRVTRIPWDGDPLQYSHIDAVVCSNGPGDPKECAVTIRNIGNILKKGIPFLGICLGHQLLALAIGADTYKLRYGHRGLNQPCLDLTTNRAYVTSQNHGYAVDRKSIPKNYTEWFVNLNDNTNEGIKHVSRPVRSVQFHPEGSPGPFDTDWIFDTI